MAGERHGHGMLCVSPPLACRLFINSGNLICPLDIERTLSSSAGCRGPKSRSAPRQLLCGVRSEVVGMAGSLPDPHGDADAVFELHYQINVNRTYSHTSTASTTWVKSMPT
jgi:hypothetical protein